MIQVGCPEPAEVKLDWKAFESGDGTVTDSTASGWKCRASSTAASNRQQQTATRLHRPTDDNWATRLSTQLGSAKLEIS
jgi:hypothetical protein